MIRPALTRLPLLAALLAALVLSLPPQAVLADGAWLGQAPPAPWNTAGGPVPAAPPAAVALDPRCANLARTPETAADGQVAAAGWTLFGTYTGGWGVQIVRGLAGVDGMCRPLQYQEFVFVDGTFAGTVSPGPMDARADGSGGVTGLADGGAQLSASFQRYAAADPLCCPSATSSVTYRIDRAPAPALLVPTAVSTIQNPGPAAAPGAPPTPACAGPTATAERLAVCLTSGVGSGVQGSSIPRSAQPGPGATEAYRLLVVQGYPVAVPGVTPPSPPLLSPLLPEIAVFNLGDFDQPNAYGGAQVESLRQLLLNRPAFAGLQGFPQGTISLPQYAGRDLSTPYTARPAYLDLPWGSGVRGVVQAGQGITPPQNGRIQYQFAGLSSDNRWLVVATFPLSVPGLPAIPQEALTANAAAIVPAQVHLSLLQDGSYTPTLSVLDAVVQSLQLAP